MTPAISTARQTWAFFYRDWRLTHRYWSWVAVFLIYAIVSSATVALIGVAANDPVLTLNLTLGVVLWSTLSVLFSEIAMSIAYERWEGTLEYTFMAPVSRFTHLMGVSLYALTYALVRAIFVLFGVALLVDVQLNWLQLPGVLFVLAISSLAFVGLGLIAAILPVMSTERGAEATNVFQSVLLLVSGIYYPISVLPEWLQPLSYLSPATYALRACRKLLGITGPTATLRDVAPELTILIGMGVVLVPLGLFIFGLAERWAKRNGKLKRTG